jgi:hypothetical protein
VNPSRDSQLALQLLVRDQLIFQRCAFRRWQSALQVIKELIRIHWRLREKPAAGRVHTQR